MSISRNECDARSLHILHEWCPGCQQAPRAGLCEHCHDTTRRPVACDECEPRVLCGRDLERAIRPYHIVRDHGVADAKGRRVGGYTAISADSVDVYAPGLQIAGILTGSWTVHTFAMRDGKRFGAWPRGKAYESREAAEKAARKALDAQGKRYRKQFGGAK